MKLVVDTNVLISGALWRGPASLLVRALLEDAATLFLTENLLAELADVLKREKFRACIEKAGKNVDAIVSRFRGAGRMTEPSVLVAPESLRDVDDLQVLACAVAASADAIVTGDLDLLVLKEFQGIPIISVTEAIRLLGL